MGTTAKGPSLNLVCLFEKIIHVAISDIAVELKEDRWLFSRMVIVANSRPDIQFRSA